jgi:membrane protease YdiL (CAAX protease family)
LALFLGWLFGVPPLATFHLDIGGTLWGLAATLPLLLMFGVCLLCPWRPLREIGRFLEESIVPLFRSCRMVDLAIIAALAGIGEEMLFRGVIQSAMMTEIAGPQGLWLGLLVSALLFGLLHPMTPTYAVLAGLIGLYLGGVWLFCGNLWPPILAHGLYDFLVILYLTYGPAKE